MGITLISRYLLVPSRFKTPYYSLIVSSPYNSASDAENYWKFLQSNASELNIEKSLTKIRGNLDSSIVEQTLRKCSTDKSILGIRFFIWAGLQPDYRHGAYMYNKACKYLDIGRGRNSFSDVLETYRKEGCMVSIKTFKVILNLCREAKLAEEALRVFRKTREFDCRPDTTVFNVVIGLFCGKGEMDVAQELMKEMALMGLYPDMSTYIVMIKGFCNVSRLEDAYRLMKLMHNHGCVPNIVVYSTLLDGFCKSGDFDKAMELLGEMEEDSGRIPNVVTYTSLIQNFCENGRTMEALTILDRMVSRGCFSNRVTVATLIKCLCSEGNIEQAYKLIDKVVANGSVSRNECYSSLIVSLLYNKNLVEAEKLFRWMLDNQIKPDGLASSTLLKQLCLEGQIINGFDYYAEMEKMGCLASIDSDIYSILLVGLCQQCHFVEAARLMSAMVKKNIKPKAPYVDTIVQALQNSGERELVLNVIKMQDNVELKDNL